MSKDFGKHTIVVPLQNLYTRIRYYAFEISDAYQKTNKQKGLEWQIW